LTTDDAERVLLAERILAEQEERRRLAELLHDGPVQHLSAISQMLDAGLASLRGGETQRADDVFTRGLALARDSARDLRALCDDLEPKVLREVGFAAAVAALVRRISSRYDVEIDLDVDYADELGENAQTALYQILREALDQAVKRGAPTRIEISVRATPIGGAELIVTDDGSPRDVVEQLRRLPVDRLVTSPSNTGLGANTNRGLRAATGQYILHHQDDFGCRSAEPFVDRAIQVMERHREVGLVKLHHDVPHPPRADHVLPDGTPYSILEFDRPPPGIGIYIYSDHPHLKRVAFHERAGYFTEGLSAHGPGLALFSDRTLVPPDQDHVA